MILCGDDVRLNYLLFFLMKNAGDRNDKYLTIDQSIAMSVKMTVTTAEEQ